MVTEAGIGVLAGDEGEEIGTQTKGGRLSSRLRSELQVLRGAHSERSGQMYLTELIRYSRSPTDMPQTPLPWSRNGCYRQLTYFLSFPKNHDWESECKSAHELDDWTQLRYSAVSSDTHSLLRG